VLIPNVYTSASPPGVLHTTPRLQQPPRAFSLDGSQEITMSENSNDKAAHAARAAIVALARKEEEAGVVDQQAVGSAAAAEAEDRAEAAAEAPTDITDRHHRPTPPTDAGA
jgi:hypothetical protein